ncbi:MAG: gliding motility-associated C-terminal domain-containing protein [Bacteroidota bacterium]|nr:gliding motility-associated C-terminal domain-containing protein [Bacteroidota bacterium]
MKKLLIYFLLVIGCVNSYAQLSCNAGADRTICPGTTTTIGGSPTISGGLSPFTITWAPATGLSSATVANPVVTITGSVTYTLTVKDSRDSIDTDVITVGVYPLITISAGADTTINSGQVITLSGSPFDSLYSYSWTTIGNSGINYSSTFNPDVSPTDTSDFILTITDNYGCKYSDTVRVNVIPSSDLYFYNSITPNGDGENEVWVIKNLDKYPKNKLEIFNRYGQQIYSVHGYKNDWNGKYLGQDLPGGTYFYILDTNTDKGKYKGTITIFR